MADVTRHWTSRSVDDFLFSVGFDFVTQIQEILEAKGEQRKDFAKALGVSKGRASQLLNNPGNLTLRKMIESALAAEHKVAVVVYDDGDPTNTRGPVYSSVFGACWSAMGKPQDMHDVTRITHFANTAEDRGRQLRMTANSLASNPVFVTGPMTKVASTR